MLTLIFSGISTKEKWLSRLLVSSWVYHCSEPTACQQYRTATEWSGFGMMELCRCAMLVLLSTSRLFGATVDGVLWIFPLNCFSLLSGSTAAAGVRQCRCWLVFSLGAMFFLTSAVAEQPLKLSSVMGCGSSTLKRRFFSLGK